MTSPLPNAFLNREVSWLEFNRRVLEEAQDPQNPLLERLRFYCIFYSNLDEFFMVRIASLMHSIREQDIRSDSAGFTPSQQLEMIIPRVQILEDESYGLYQRTLVPAMASEGIVISTGNILSPVQQNWLDDYFAHEVYPVLTPLAIHKAQPFPRLPGLSVNLALLLAQETDPEPRLAIVPVPTGLADLVRIPDSGQITIVWLQDIIRCRLSLLFRGYRILEVAGFRLTRDSELELDDEGGLHYLPSLEAELKKRRMAQPVRVEYEAAMSPQLLRQVQIGLGIEDSTFLPVHRPLDPRPLLSLVDMQGFDRLRYAPQPPLIPAPFVQREDVFEIIRDEDVLLHHPYDSFDPVARFVQVAAEDPDVLAIKQTLYRIGGGGSPILGALIRAARNGKQVTVLVELTARFDEERNIHWSKDLEEAGAHVLYGIVGLKVHAKITLVVRRESGGIRRYVHLGTGNYNDRTARLYTDMGLLTADEDFGRDASDFFNTISGYSEPPAFSRLLMAPHSIRDNVRSLIRREADWARSGQSAEIMAKMNSLVDPAIIKELYKASEAGVSIRLCVRGICCLKPGVPGLSQNITVISIVDRYLEHSRLFVFHNGGSPEVYLSSADWMPRNLDRRVELMFPLINEDARKNAIDSLRIQFMDNQKARRLRPDGDYERFREGTEPIRAQIALYERMKQERERVLSITPVRFTPIESKK